mmetsp:Transcript_28765/g.83222  ORF Transcript_28765/g.83222 Transcript_28765/m.83222 type:complete len:226 (-) Transcript_28765:249-926(-)
MCTTTPRATPARESAASGCWIGQLERVRKLCSTAKENRGRTAAVRIKNLSVPLSCMRPCFARSDWSPERMPDPPTLATAPRLFVSRPLKPSAGAVAADVAAAAPGVMSASMEAPLASEMEHSKYQVGHRSCPTNAAKHLGCKFAGQPACQAFRPNPFVMPQFAVAPGQSWPCPATLLSGIHCPCPKRRRSASRARRGGSLCSELWVPLRWSRSPLQVSFGQRPRA